MLRRKKSTKTKVGIKDPEIVKPKEKKDPPGKPPKQIKMLIMLANQHHVYLVGHSYKVPGDVSVKTARSWINSGVAEEVEE